MVNPAMTVWRRGNLNVLRAAIAEHTKSAEGGVPYDWIVPRMAVRIGVSERKIKEYLRELLHAEEIKIDDHGMVSSI